MSYLNITLSTAVDKIQSCIRLERVFDVNVSVISINILLTRSIIPRTLIQVGGNIQSHIKPVSHYETLIIQQMCRDLWEDFKIYALNY